MLNAIDRLDLNLLHVFQAIYETRSISRAAERRHVTQPALSNALGRLRLACGDRLFVHTPGGMQPTPYALRLAAPIQRALSAVATAFRGAEGFQPATSERTFAFHMTDMGQMNFLPQLLERLQNDAPRVRIDAITLPAATIPAALEDGRVAFAISTLPAIRGRGIRAEHLFEDRYEVVARAGHPLGGGRLALKSFVAAAHAVVAPPEGHRVIEDKLTRARVPIAVRVPNFMVIPMLLARTDLLATVPHRLARELTASGAFHAYPLPVRIPPYKVGFHWHQRFEDDAALAWMRALLIEVFRE